MLLKFTVPGLPVGKGRARATTIAGRVRMFTPAKTQSYEAILRHYAQEAMIAADYKPFECALYVSVNAVFPKPASWSKKRAATTFWHTGKPDADNLLKCLDGLNGVVWRDDSQISRASIQKFYSNDGRAHLQVFVEAIEGEAHGGA